VAQTSSIRLPNSFTEAVQPRSLSRFCDIDELVDLAIATFAALAALMGSTPRDAPAGKKHREERLREVHG
jgi:hypothetical protein